VRIRARTGTSTADVAPLGHCRCLLVTRSSRSHCASCALAPPWPHTRPSKWRSWHWSCEHTSGPASTACKWRWPRWVRRWQTRAALVWRREPLDVSSCTAPGAASVAAHRRAVCALRCAVPPRGRRRRSRWRLPDTPRALTRPPGGGALLQLAPQGEMRQSRPPTPLSCPSSQPRCSPA